MKRKLLILLLGISIFSLNSQTKQYEVKSGEIEYDTTININGKSIKSKNITWFDDYGSKSAQRVISDFDIFTGTPSKTDTTTITNGNRIHILNNIEKSYITMINDDDEDDDYEEPVKKGKDKIAGKDCDIYESGYAEDGERYFEKMWIWKGIPLKIETETKSQIMTIKSDTTAVKVDIKNISSSQFTIPSGYKENTEASRGFEAFDNMMKMLGE